MTGTWLTESHGWAGEGWKQTVTAMGTGHTACLDARTPGKVLSLPLSHPPQSPWDLPKGVRITESRSQVEEEMALSLPLSLLSLLS